MKGLKEKLEKRALEGKLRRLRLPANLVDFCSNDYLGFSRSTDLKERIDREISISRYQVGSTGSRLVTGNSEQFEKLEAFLADFHCAESGLIFNSGYDANLGLFSSVPERADTILFDELSHSSIRDGIRLSFAKSFSFRHNDLEDLTAKLQRAKGNIFITAESVYSMDGDCAPLKDLSILAEQYGANLIIDEAHATGIFGEKGRGLVCEMGLQEKIFARVHTFGKAIGSHGAIVVGSKILRDYLINFARPFIYSTALSPHSLTAIEQSYDLLSHSSEQQSKLLKNIRFFQALAADIPGIRLQPSAIQVQIIPGNENAKAKSEALALAGFDVRPILSPTVSQGQERLRICMHSYNSEQEIKELVEALKI